VGFSRVRSVWELYVASVSEHAWLPVTGHGILWALGELGHSHVCNADARDVPMAAAASENVSIGSWELVPGWHSARERNAAAFLPSHAMILHGDPLVSSARGGWQSRHSGGSLGRSGRECPSPGGAADASGQRDRRGRSYLPGEAVLRPPAPLQAF